MPSFKKNKAVSDNNPRRFSFISLFSIEGICGVLIAFYYLTGRWSFSRVLGETGASFIFEPRNWFFFAVFPLLMALLYRKKLIQEKIRYDSVQIISIGCFIIYMVFSMGWAPDMELALDKGLELLLMLVALFVISFMLTRTNPETIFLCFWASLILIIGSFALIALVSIDFTSITRVRVLGGGSNYFGRLMGLLCFGSLLMQKYKPNVYIWVPVIALSSILVVLSGSRGALVAYIGGILTYLILEKVRLKQIILFLSILIVLMGFLNYTSFGQKAIETFEHRVIRKVLEEGDYSSRPEIYRSAYDLWMEHPVKGAGLAAFPASGIGSYPHNLFLEALCEGGVIGFLLLITTFIIFLFKIKSIISNTDSASFAALVLLLIGSQFSGDFYNQRGVFIFILMITYSAYYSKFSTNKLKLKG